MEALGYIRIVVLLISLFAFLFLTKSLSTVKLEGITVVWSGLGLVMLNLLVGSIFHSTLLSEKWKEEVLPVIGFVTGYIGQTLGLILVLVGVYRIIRSLLPQLRASERLYEELVDSLEAIVYEVDAKDFKFTFVSKKCEQLLGYPQQLWLEELAWEKLIHPDDVNRVVEFCAEATREKRNHTIEFRALDAKGRTVWLRDIASVILENGEPVRIRGALIDISEQKIAEQASRENEQKLRTIIDAEPQCVKLVSADGKILQMNRAGLAMIEAENELQVLGTSVYPLVDPKDRNAFRALLERTLKGEKGSLEFEIIGLRGKRRLMETHAVPFWNGQRIDSARNTPLFWFPRSVIFFV